MSDSEVIQELKNSLNQYPNFPQEGILFEDFLPIFRSPDLFNKLIQVFKNHIEKKFASVKIDYVVGLEARGFLFAPTLALALNAGFIPVRKQGKLPGKTVSATFQKEYGEDVFEIQSEDIKTNANVIIVDDILATGGSAGAAGNLFQKVNANILEFIFVMELDFLKGRDKLPAPVYTLFGDQKEALK
ncbi:adenine phosphoribosyltransferase APT1 [Ascoidea rubescens DSM 1968]|uniref:adenine phosphoribosyltransferase n=1 Tax=Ascoidea rubescens DSM 1968 TaxID=1344418 RepID=A0A1D2V955_9ASCO|nr:adenine phosphoribosyltransferase [Ascoidea rubescens DSM 1968]ODV58035.1 adenine phosphoribosyltransferase [Ascoidea rubescens DSM 1968]